MSVDQKLGDLKNTIVLAECVSYPTLMAARLSKVFIYLASSSKEGMRAEFTYTIPVSLVKSFFPRTNKSIEELGLFLEDISDFKINWKWHNRALEGKSVALATCELCQESMSLNVNFNQDFVEHYNAHNTSFKNIPLKLFLEFKERHAIKAFELAFQYFRPQHGKGKTKNYSTIEMRSFFGIKPEDYPETAIFLREVVKKACVTASRVSGFKITYHNNKKRGQLAEHWFEIYPENLEHINTYFKSIGTPAKEKAALERRKFIKEITQCDPIYAKTLKDRQTKEAEEEKLREEEAKKDKVRGALFLEHFEEEVLALKGKIPQHTYDTWFNKLFERPVYLPYFAELMVLGNDELLGNVSEEKKNRYKEATTLAGLN